MTKKQKTDDELTDLLTLLYTMQEDVGARPPSTDDEKKKQAETVAATMGTKSGKAAKKGSRFLELKSTLVNRLKTIHGMLKEIKEKEDAGFGGNNPKEIIKLQAEVREHVRQAQDEWKELDTLYKGEARKKRSKFTTEELNVQETLVTRLYQEIEKIKEAQMAGYKRAGEDQDSRITTTLGGMSTVPGTTVANSTGGGTTSWTSGGGGVALTGDQRQQIQMLEERDADFDTQLDEIGEGIEDLAEIAKLQGEESAKQNVMLLRLSNKIDNVQEKMTTVNSRMKETLDEVGRSSDKLCVDIMCIVLACGFGAVFYNMAKGG